MIRAIALDGASVWWADLDGVYRDGARVAQPPAEIARALEAPRTEGTITITVTSGLIVERDGDTARVIAQSRPGHDLSPGVIAVDAHAVYAVEVRPDGAEAIVAHPRPGHGPIFVGTMGETRDASASRLPATVTGPVAALTVTDDAVYWIDGTSLWRMTPGAAPTAVWTAEVAGPLQQTNAAFAVLADGTIVTTTAGFTVGDLIAIDRGGAVRTLATMNGEAFGPKVVASGAHIYYVVGGTQVWTTDGTSAPTRVLGPTGEIVDLAAGGDGAYAAVMTDGVAHVIEIAAKPIDLGAAYGFVPGTLEARAGGVSYANEDAKAILMLQRPVS
ncbi:MAG TPA: hypothetical protein VL463_35505 [Kofleriaceae bacterium]|nr:hypothetical protein [Kofleriaceae bacterium]